MSTGQLSHNRSISISSSHSSKGKGKQGYVTTLQVPGQSMAPTEYIRDFDPCAATASMFLYAQGNSVVCVHHDTLTIERQFSRHAENVQLLAVDTVSERGAGRLVVSYDAGQTAIVWDCMTGDELARFASYENLTAAAWMGNGSVAFGNSQGNVILFEPTTSEHISARAIDQIPITSLAPAADCRTHAIGFANGSLLIAALQPRFTILHNLTTSRGPSPIITLAWHGTSSHQKSDMLATQTRDGDVRVWNVAKSDTGVDTARVVRIIRRSEHNQSGPNWLGWSKNGRIVQFSESETLSWDVRTKHVTYETVPTLEHVSGLAIYGPGATLFTLGRNNSIQQFDLNSPPQLVANVQHQHPANLLPPSPPVSIEEHQNNNNNNKKKKKKPQDASATNDTGDISMVPINMDISESDEDHMSPLARIAREMDKLEEDPARQPDRADTMSSASSRSYASTTSRSSAGSRARDYYYPKYPSVLSHGFSDATTMSMGSSIHSDRDPSVASSRKSLSLSSTRSSQSNASARSRPRGAQLRHEVLRSPDDAKAIDLFRFTKARLSNIPYHQPRCSDNSRLTNHDLRRQMLNIIFGWDGEAESLVEDELRRHPPDSPSRVLLVKWLGDVQTDIMATSSEFMTSSDWMLLALSGIGRHASQTSVARAYAQRLLEKGDIHMATTIMIGIGDQNEAIEIYVSHKMYMEALILTCLIFPADWPRQAELIQKWGEWAVQHGEQQLAIRCFSCIGSESSEPWSSPRAQALNFSQLQSQKVPEMLSPPLSPPGGGHRGPKRTITKISDLKLITSFGDKSDQNEHVAVAAENERTPTAVGVTATTESGLLSAGSDTPYTAVRRPSHRSAYHTPASARTATPGGFTRQRLPSIGEGDVIPRRKLEPAKPQPPLQSGSSSDKEGGKSVAARAHERNPSQPETNNMILSSATYVPVQRAATANPTMQKQRTMLSNPLPSPSPDSFTSSKREARARNGSRHRKPDGLQIQWPPIESILTGDYMASSRAGVGIGGSDATSITPPSTGGTGRSPLMSERSYRSAGTASPMVTGRSIDEYISSLESAQHHVEKQRRHRSRERLDKHARARSGTRKLKGRERSEARGLTADRYIKPAKQSPTSPAPMSPEDLRDLGAIGYCVDEMTSPPIRSESRIRNRSRLGSRPARASSRARQSSSPDGSSRILGSEMTASRVGSRTTSRHRRRPSPDTHLRPIEIRIGRNKGREGSAIRSPSSPLPMSPQMKFYQCYDDHNHDDDDDDDDDDLRRAKEDQRRFRSRNRSASRLREPGTSSRSSTARDVTPERGRLHDSPTSRWPGGRGQSQSRIEPTPHPKQECMTHACSESDPVTCHAQRMKDLQNPKKQQAARELEERRKSLARRPSVPPIIHPEELARLSPVSYRPSSSQHNRSATYPETKVLNARPSRGENTLPVSQQISSVYQEKSHRDNNGKTCSSNSSSSNNNINSSSGVQVGLPATPRAMRHPKYDPEGKDIPDVPQISGRYMTVPPPPSWGNLDAISYSNAIENLAPLPKTAYRATRRQPLRSASAPIPEEPLQSPNALPSGLPTHPAFHVALPPSSRRRPQEANTNRPPQLSSRKIIPGDSQPGTLGYETRNIQAQSLNSSNDIINLPPRPPPPPPPILKELQHLAVPPPPPPAPLHRPGHSIASRISGVSRSSGVIEIVMDDDHNDHDYDDGSINNNSKDAEDSYAKVIDVPSPKKHHQHILSLNTSTPISSNHSRGRSDSDNTLGGRFSRATERLKNASRGFSGSDSGHGTISSYEASPYESIPILRGSNRSANSTPGVHFMQNVVERHPREVKATMMEMEGGMI